MTAVSQLVDHLFRHEWGRLVATLVRVLGVRRVDLAEDVAQDALCRALEVWSYRGVPENPSAWLFESARHRAVDLLRRQKSFLRARPSLVRKLPAKPDEHQLLDDQLRMMLSCAHPGIPAEAQVALILRVLCGFGVSEIAQAFLSSPAGIEKRLLRAKEVMKTRMLPELREPEPQARRLDSVHRALYLLFSEGYHGSHPERAVREELCAEALRLGSLLAQHPATATAPSFALMGLLCLHAARLPSRIDPEGSLIPLESQDRSRWDSALIGRGFQFLSQSAQGDVLSPFHLEAGIAALHAQARSFEETDWSEILGLYTKLLRLCPSPVVALNRAIALGWAQGPEAGLSEIDRIRREGSLRRYPFLEAAAGDFHRRAGRMQEARIHFQKAQVLARSEPERRFLDRKLDG